MTIGSFEAFALPMPGNKEHTYVAVQGYPAFKCFGRNQGGRLVVSGKGDTRFGSYLAGPKGNGYIRYLFSGVCHQAANRILVPSDQLLSHSTKGYRGGFPTGSYLLYGAYGKRLTDGTRYSPKYDPWPQIKHLTMSNRGP